MTLFPNREMLDLVRRRRQGARHRRAQPADRRARVARRRRRLLATGGYGTAYYLSTNAVNSNVTAAWRCSQARRALRQPVLHADPPDLHPGVGRPPVEAHADEREPAQRRPRLGAEDAGRHAAAAADPRGRARLLPRAAVPELRQPGARATSRRAPPRRSATRAAASARRSWPSISTSPTRSSRVGEDTMRAALRQPVPDVREDHRRGSVQGADADLPRRPLHDGRAVGGLQPDEHDSRACTCSAKRTSPTTAPTASAPARSCRAWPTATSSSRTRSATTSPARRCPKVTTDHDAFKEADRVGARRASSGCWPCKGKQTARELHRELGQRPVGLRRHGPHRRRPADRARQDPAAARGVLAERLGPGRAEQRSTRTSSTPAASPTTWSSASCWRCDALERRESCGGHFREEYQTPDNEARRDDEQFAHVAAWEYRGRRTGAGAPRRAAGVRVRAPDAAELQVMARMTSPPRLAAGRRRSAPGRPRRRTQADRTSRRTCRSSRCSTSSTRA